MKLVEFKLLVLLQILKAKNRLKEDSVWIEYKKENKNNSVFIQFGKNLLRGQLTYGGFPVCNHLFHDIEITRWEKDPERIWFWKRVEDRRIDGERITKEDFEYIYSLLKSELNLWDKFKIWFSEFRYKWQLLKLASKKLEGRKLKLRVKLILLKNTYKFLYEWFN